MSLQVNETKNNENSGRNRSCPMDAAGWNLSRLKIGEDTISSVRINGQDLILIEDVGTAHQTLKPLSGDFSVVSKFMHDGEQWLEKHGQPGVGMNIGHSLWLEWRQRNLDHNVELDEFFETYLGQEPCLTPSVM
jgi:hypothetical protein